MKGRSAIQAISVVIATATVIGLVLFRSSAIVGRNAPPIPPDVFHNSVIASAACLTCHTPGRQVPMKETHPAETECYTCHRTTTMR